MDSQAFMDVRATLNTTTNTTGGDSRTGVGGVEIQKRIEEIPVEAFNRETDLARLLRRRNGNQLAFIWNVTTESAAGGGLATSSFAFYSDGGTGTPQRSAKTQLVASAKSYRTDYEVSNLMIAAGIGNQLQEEATHAARDLAVGEERSIICGSDTSAYGFSSAFAGLLQLMNSNATLGDTTTIFGTARASARDELDVGLVAGAATSAAALALSDLDAALTISSKRGAKNHRRIWFCSEDRRDEIDDLLVSNQRFVAPSINVEGGFRVSSYRAIPIIGSRFMDKNGRTWDGSVTAASHLDQAMYLLDLENIHMYHVAGVNASHVPLVGAEAQQRADVRGGYYKSYGVLVMTRFDTQVLIYNLTDI